MDFNYIVLDCETGGLFPEKNPICQVALVVLSGINFEEKFSYETYVRPYKNLVYEDKALQFNGITMKEINSGKEAKLVVKELIECFTTYKCGRVPPILVGHNIKFDMDMLKALFFYHGENLFKYIGMESIDTMWLARLKHQVDDESRIYKLKDCCEREGIQLFDAHQADVDIQATAELFKIFVSGLRSGAGEVAQSTTKFRETFHF